LEFSDIASLDRLAADCLTHAFSIMRAPSNTRWVEWSKRLQAIAQNGLTFAQDHYDIERYKAVQQLAAEMLAEGSDLEQAVILGLLEKETGYTTPKVDVRGVVFRDDKLLLVRERSDGKWSLPGGWADVCASPAENIVREIYEESGFETRATKILAVFDRSKHSHELPFAFHVYKIFMLCTITGGAEAVSSETDAVGFFGEQQIPELSTSRVTTAQISRMFEHHRNSDLPTDFDHEVESGRGTPSASVHVNIFTPSLELRLRTKSEVLLEYNRSSPEDKAQVAPEWLALVESSQDSDPWVHGFKMMLRSDGTEVGRCGFTGPPDSNGIVEIAYGVDEEFRSHGYATEAAKSLSSYASADARVRVIRAHTLPTENASAHILRKCGFSRIGESMDHAAGIVWRWEKVVQPA
jgi:ADP-ribose pyrophosphatase YjhB (NUDIX family)/RimJ/RimL family protein N-acetyltransferase